jgi:hypothetical protein
MIALSSVKAEDANEIGLMERAKRTNSWERQKDFEGRMIAAPASICLRFGAKLQELLAEFPSDIQSCCRS